ncbi:FAD dependent oxidoreductase [Aspergillus filifer]
MVKPTLAPNSITSFWRTEPHALDNHRSTPSLPSECDIAIIGAGYAGASVAHHILNQTSSLPKGKRPSIVILEGREACSGATGRNGILPLSLPFPPFPLSCAGGHLKPDPYNRIASLAREHGLDAAREVAEFEARHVDAIAALVEREKIDCDLSVTEAIDVHTNPEYAKVLKSGYDLLVERGVQPTVETRYIPREGAEEFSGIKNAVACFTYKAAHLWPYRLILHLLQKAVDAGVNLQTNTPVTSITKLSSSSEQIWTLSTPRGNLKTKTVILATNGYTSSLLPQYQTAITPVRGTCSRILVPPSHYTYNPDLRLTKSYIIRHNDWNYDYLIPRSDGSIVVGGARPAFYNEREKWFNVSDDSQVLEKAVRYFDGYMQRTFKGWEGSGAYTDRVWTGIMGYSSDNIPHVGKVPGSEGVWVIAGFTGHGMPQVYLSAEGLARMVVGGVGFGESGLPRLFETRGERLISRESQSVEQKRGCARL